MYGCVLHLGQIFEKKSSRRVYASKYKSDKSFRLNIKMLLSLTFVSPSFVLLETIRLKKYFLTEKCSLSLKIFD